MNEKKSKEKKSLKDKWRNGRKMYEQMNEKWKTEIREEWRRKDKE